MWTNGLKIAITLLLILSLTGCSSPVKKQELIKKQPVVVDYGSNAPKIVQYGNGTYIYRDRQYPGLD